MKSENERLREALRPFAAFEAVRRKQGGCTPKSGTVWAVASRHEEAEITVEHLQAAVAALSQQAEPAPAQDELVRLDKQCRDDVAAALGFTRGGDFAWSYLLSQISECVRLDVTPPDARPAQTEHQPEQSADMVLSPEAQKVLTDCIGAHAYIVATITNSRPDLALAEASKWVEAFREASAALSAQGGE